MRVEAHESIEELKQQAKLQREARMRIRLQAVVLAREGKTAPQIAAALGAARRAVQEWVARYNRNGIDGLKEGVHTGKPPKLPKDQHEQFKARLDAGALPADGVCTLRAADVRRILEKEFGVVYRLKGIYKLLHRLGYSCLSPRPRHRLSDPAQQAAFKKTSPSRSSRFRPLIGNSR